MDYIPKFTVILTLPQFSFIHADFTVCSRLCDFGKKIRIFALIAYFHPFSSAFGCIPIGYGEVVWIKGDTSG